MGFLLFRWTVEDAGEGNQDDAAAPNPRRVRMSGVDDRQTGPGRGSGISRRAQTFGVVQGMRFQGQQPCLTFLKLVLPGH